MDMYFESDPTSYPTSLLKDDIMRLSLSKFLLNSLVLKPCVPCNRSEGETLVDGGALLWSVKWSKHEKFQSIAQIYLNKYHSLKVSTVVFDGFEPSTKFIAY